MARLLRSIQAEADLAEIWLHIALDNPDAADAQISRIAAQCEMLAANPAAGRLRTEIAAGLRSFPAGNYLLLYRPDTKGIELLRVIHAARELVHVFSRVEEPRVEYRLAS